MKSFFTHVSRQTTRLLYALLLFCWMPWLAQAQCPTSDVTLSSQAEVNAFPPGCVNFTGKLVIRGSDITSLTALRNIQSVDNNFEIINNSQLTTLTGLQSLTSVGYSLIILNNPKLTNLAALSALATTSDLEIRSNAELVDLTGLQNLKAVRSDLTIHSNPKLTSLAALSPSSVRVIEINNNAELADLTGLQNLTAVRSYFYIQGNDKLTSIAALSALTRISGRLVISNNAALTTLTGLQSLTSLGDLIVDDNLKLTSLAPLSGLTRIGFILEISSNPQLTTLTGLQNLTAVGQYLRIIGNPKLTNLTALSGVTNLGSDLVIWNNAELTTLTGLNSLTLVDRDVSIQFNPKLTSLVALNPNLHISRNLTITDNGLLSQCAVSAICQHLANPPAMVTISGNATGCASRAEVEATCNYPIITQQPASQSVVCAGTTVTASVSISGNVTAYQWYKDSFASPVLSQTTATLSLTNVSLANAGSYLVVISSPYNSLTSTAFNLTVHQPSVDLNNNGPLTCTQPQITLTASSTATGGYVFRGSGGSISSIGNSATVSQPGTYTVTLNTPAGCSASATTTVGSNTALAAPTLLTQTGQSYPGGVNRVTVSQYSPPVALVASGCAGTVSWTGPNSTSGTGSITVGTAQTGTQIYQAICRLGGCTSPSTSATVTVGPALLRVLHQDNDRDLTNNIIRPYLQLQNDGTSPLAYGEITMRYWLTVEDFSPMTNLSVYWAQLGTNKVRMKYVELTQSRQGAFGYVEYSFDASAGNLAPGANSGPIQNGIGKQDWTAFNEADDHSYVNNSNFTANPRITAYRNGTLIWGTEPASSPGVQTLKVYTQNRSSTSTNSISTFLQLRNEGNLPVNYTDVKVRYYFTADGTQPLNFYLDYAQLGNQNVQGKFIRISPPLVNADTYLELSFPNLGTLYPLSSTGNIQYRIAKQDWSSFSQANDHSYLNNGAGILENNRVAVYLAGVRVWGTEPGAGARLATTPEDVPLTVTVLGNPVVGPEIEAEIQGASGQALRFEVIDAAGRLLAEQQVYRAGLVERQRLLVGQESAGVLLLRVSTVRQTQTIRVLKTE